MNPRFIEQAGLSDGNTLSYFAVAEIWLLIYKLLDFQD